MSLITQLSSQTGDKTEASNIAVSKKVLQNPELIEEIVLALNTNSKDVKLLGDCMEIMTKVAEEKAELVSPFIEIIIPFLSHKNTRVRWEATHTLALIATEVPEKIKQLIPDLMQTIEHDSSTIVKDYSVETLARYAGINEKSAAEALPLLMKTLELAGEKQAARVMRGLGESYKAAPALKSEIKPIAEEYLESSKASVKKAAKSLLKLLK